METKTSILEVDLNQGVVPISRAASSLASLVKRSRANRQPIIVTQKGYPTGVILDIGLFTDLRKLAEQTLDREAQEGKYPLSDTNNGDNTSE